MERAWLFSLVPFVIGTAFLGFGAHGLRRARVLGRVGVTARARIVRHEIRRGEEGARFHHPVAAWTTRDGTACAYASRFGRGTVGGRFGVGAYVTVRYDPKAPHRFVIEGWDSTVVDRLFLALGTVLTVGTAAVVLGRLLTL
ncbi:hypothetical protein GCM10018785_29500 [Streptomyces longispororuber]|uniref:DUF3592 domain-containing protein n=1 Tax=Streptomyces longispororuber TaxID=68230 RepID=A0A918ZL39_9ACTN|nr:DUF3592 domain-containing protein [Streptomyces longispororuber]GHE58384.1 hypothetical protein GCM10018785_29500 [Streptomyces longispororuber]